MIYCPSNETKIKEELSKLGLSKLEYEFDFEGVKSYKL